MRSASSIISDDDLVKKAKEILDPSTFDFISGGAGEEWGVSNNISAFQRYQIVPRVLQSTGGIDTTSKLFGEIIPSPVLIAPCAFHKLVCAEGEVATARAAEKTKTIFTLSTMSTCSIDEVASASKFNKWFQLYLFKDRQITQELVSRAESCGYLALVVTVDVPAMGMRIRDIKNKFSLPQGMDAANFRKFQLSSMSDKVDGSKIKELTDQQFDANLNWDSIAWLKSITKLPIILKGILSPEDAEEAVKQNVDGIIVSNHGGRQIDSVISSLDALPDIVRVVSNRIPIIIDGGIRSGEDIFKAIALGADAVMIARPVMWALAVGGVDELISYLTRLQNELMLTMRLAGCNSLQLIKERGLSLLSGPNVIALRFLELIRKLDGNSQVLESSESAASTIRFFMGMGSK